MGGDVDIPAFGAQHVEVGAGGFRARQDNHGGVHRDRLAGLDEDHVDVGLGGEGVEVVEVGDSRDSRHGDDDAPALAREIAVFQGHCIFRRELARVAEPRHHAQARQAGEGLDAFRGGGEQGDVAPELVDQVAHQAISFAIRNEGVRAHDRGDHAAPVDVADQHHRHVGGLGEAHVGDVVGAQVDFRGAARTLHQNDVALGLELVEARQHVGHQRGFARKEIPRARRALHLAPHHHLRADVGLRLQQHRVHVHARLNLAGQCLQRLRPPDLATVGGHRRVVRHVLRLERPNRHPPPHQRPAQPGHQHRLADIRAGALKHDRGHFGVRPFVRVFAVAGLPPRSPLGAMPQTPFVFSREAQSNPAA